MLKTDNFFASWTELKMFQVVDKKFNIFNLQKEINNAIIAYYYIICKF